MMLASRKVGTLAEDLFQSLCVHRGWHCYKGGERPDIKGHWDVLIARKAPNTDIEHYRVDVKAPKKFSRHDETIANDWICIEFKNVKGRNGWLYGEADLIAFFTEGYCSLIRRDVLLTTAVHLTRYGTPDAEYVELLRCPL